MADPNSTMSNTLAVHLASLTKSFSLVPPASVPAVIDCVLTSSVLSVSYLFSSLLQSFPDFNEAPQSNYILCYTSALCHLMKNDRAPPDAMIQFISRVFIPLLEAIDHSNSDLLNQTEELLYQVVFETGSWDLMEKILVPFCLKSTGLSMKELQKDEMGIDERPFEFSSEFPGSLPKQTAYRVLTCLLEFALRSVTEVTTSEQKILHFSSSSVSFTMNLTWKLSNLALGLLKLSAEDRSYAIRLLLPVVLRSLNVFSLFEVLEHEPQCSLPRSLFLEKIWNCCYYLFQLGHIERRDAYTILSLYFSSFYDFFGDEKITVVNINEEFDLTGNGVFWEHIQRGLVDRDSSVRKMALYILKLLLNYRSSLLSGNDQCSSTCTEVAAISKKSNSISQDRDILHVNLTKKEKWAEREAKSMGVGDVSHLDGTCLNCGERWKIFVLLYEMLEEYGTHLVEAAWNHQILILFQSSLLNNDQGPTSLEVYHAQMERLEGFMSWLAVLWERGFCHENPQVRCLTMESFLGIDWDRYENHARKVPRSFILGPLLRGLNDPVQHKDFGLKGTYMSRTIEGASKYLSRVSCRLSVSERLTLAWSLASIARHEPFGRAGLMALAFCISSTTCRSNANDEPEKQCPGAISIVEQVDSTQSNNIHCSAVELLDALQIIIGRSKHHFNPNYRLQVSEQVLKAASLLINVYDVSLEVLLHFLSTVPREFIDINGSVRLVLQAWIAKITNHGNIGLIDCRTYLLKNLFDFPSSFIYHGLTSDGSLLFDDEDIDAWLIEAQRWAWMLFLVVREDEDLVPLFELFKSYCGNLCKEPSKDRVCIKLLILILCFIEESQVVWKKLKCHGEAQDRTELIKENVNFSVVSALVAFEKFTGQFPVLMDEIVSFARLVLPVFWSISIVNDIQLPSSIKGKLGGPTQRRLATSTTSAVLLSIMAMRTIASLVSLCALINEDIPDSFFTFSWEFVWKVIQFQPYQSETGSELCLAAYEALAYVLKALSPNFGLSHISLMMSYNKLEFTNGDIKPLLDHLLLSFLNGVNDLLANGLLTRSRRALLIDWKWNCLDSLLSIPYNSLEQGVQLEECTFFSGSALQSTLADINESLETAGENSVLSILRSMRLVLGLYSYKVGSTSSCQGVNSQMMFKLVKSSWLLHLSCNKRRVAPIAALLSAVLHESVFDDLTMHETDGSKGPLKWFIQKLLDEGTKSPRTMRLAALHLTGLWLLHPRTLKYYMKELILLSLYGSVAFDEDFEAELCGNDETKVEVSLLAQSPDPELTEVFINTELYARVAVAVLFNKLHNFSNGGGRLEKGDCAAALNCGKMFLLEFLDSVVNERDLSKELYKKFSGVHRRKVRAWQIICILSHFVEEDILENVTSKLHICLYRNNLPSVRQYLETFAIQIYLKFPTLAEEQLIPIFNDYKMRPQALSSYVFIAANVILHSRDLPVQMKHLDKLLPPVFPFLTSHHHSLRCFSQLLVYHVLCKLRPAFTACKSDLVPLEGRCFDNLKSYLAGNIDCVRIRASMEGFLENFDPIASATPAGVFNSRSEGSEFECVPVSLMELVIAFLNDVRDDLRSSSAKDETAVKNETLTENVIFEDIFNSKETSPLQILKDPSLDFQKKITPHIHEGQPAYNHLCLLASSNSSSILSELEMEDLLLSSVIQSRKEVVERIRNDQQQIILVASLLDRIPNLAGLARTCEIFKAACLTVADSSILQDKQFQLISVTAEKWVPVIEVPVCSIKIFLEKKRREGFSILGLEQTANSTALDKFSFPKKTVLVLGREKEGIPVDIIHVLDACIEIPQLGIIRSLNVHVSSAIALWEYTRQQRGRPQ